MRIFVVKDKSGRKVHMSKERWAHIQKHLKMADKVEQIMETLRQPGTVTTFAYDEQVRFYYRYYKQMKSYLFVSVKYLNGEGFVITSFYTDKIK